MGNNRLAEPFQVTNKINFSNSNEKQLRASLSSREFEFAQLPAGMQTRTSTNKNTLKSRMVKKNKQQVVYKVTNPESVLNQVQRSNTSNMMIRDDESDRSPLHCKGVQIEEQTPGAESLLKDGKYQT